MDVPGRASRIGHIVNVVLTYWIISISMVFFNKWLVGGTSKSSHDVSIFVAWSQSVVCVIFILIYPKIGSLVRADITVSYLSSLYLSTCQLVN